MKERYIRDIKASFPYPIAASFVRLFTDECLDPGALRLQHILGTAEAVARFLGVVVLCECREHFEGQAASLPAALATDFNTRFKRVTWGNWLHFAREGIKSLHQGQASLIAEELPGFWFASGARENAAPRNLAELLSIRNQLSHAHIQPVHQHEFKSLCDQAYPLLEQILEALDFLLDYELTFVNQIEVLKRRKHDPNYRHRISKVCGDSASFLADRQNLSACMDSHAIFFGKLQRPGCLNLDPLLIYEEAAGKAADIFFYNGMDSPLAARYTACRQGGSFTSSESQQAAEIAEDLQGFLDLCNLQTTQEAVDG